MAIRIACFTSVLIVAACGGKTLEPGSSDPLPRGPEPAPPRPEPEPEPEPEPAASCAESPAWWQPTPVATVVGPPALSVSPDQTELALLGRWGGTVMSLEAGAALDTLAVSALDPSWSRGVVHGNEIAELVDLESDEVLGALELAAPSAATPWLQLGGSELEASGTVLTVSCHSGPDDAVELAITRWGGPSSETERVSLPAETCWTNWADDVLLAPTAAGGAVTVEPGGRRLYHVTFSTGAVSSVDALVGGNPEATPYSFPILALAVDAPGERAAVATTDGKVRIWSLPSFGLLQTLDAGVVAVNDMTYMPTNESPLAWSPDGKLLAYMHPGGQLVIRDLVRTSDASTVVAPPLARDQADWVGQDAMAAKFLPSGAGLVVAFEHGVGLWRCGG